MKGIVLVLCLFVSVCAIAAPPASAPAEDQTTQDVLKDLESAPAPPATAPSPVHVEEEVGWGRLIRDFQYMLITAAALGVAAGVMGLFVLLRREALVALAIPQVVAVGAAIALRFEWPKLPPALAVALIALVYFAYSKRWAASNWIVPSFYVAGLCLSFLIIANHGQDVEELQHLFTGVDIAVDPREALIAVPILLVVGIIGALLWRRWLLLAQAPAAAELAGLRPAVWDTLFLGLLTIVLLLGTNSLGVVMVLAMLFLPAATVLPWIRRLPAGMLACALLALLSLAAGFYLSNRMEWPMSQSVGGVGFVLLVVSHTAAQFR